MTMGQPEDCQLFSQQHGWGFVGFHCFSRNICSCRFAALSVGRVEDGQLFCRYHGWGFMGGEEGRCSCNPQAVGADAEATVMNSRRSRLETYPSQVMPHSASLGRQPSLSRMLTCTAAEPA